MKKVEVKKTVELFEIGDMIMFTDIKANVNHYGIVLENQNEDRMNIVYVFSLADGKCTHWVGIRDSGKFTPCRFVAHLDNPLLSLNILHG